MSDAEAVSLPPSVDDCDERSQAASEAASVSLPPSVNSDPDEPGQAGPSSGAKVAASCCRNACLETWRGKAEELQLALASLSFHERQAKIFEEVKRVVKDNSPDGSTGSGRLKWSMFGASVCRIFCQNHCFQSNPKTIDKMIQYARSGLSELPERGPRLPRETKTSDELDVWFLEVYKNLAEPLAVEGSESSKLATAAGEQHELVVDETHPLYAMSVNLDGKKSAAVPKRFLNFAVAEDLWRFYEVDVPKNEQCSRNTVMKGYQRWKRFLPLKDPGDGTKCSICATLAERKAQCSTKVEREQVNVDLKHHLECVRGDRTVNNRTNKHASEKTVYMSKDRYMKVMIDGMDQAKFCLPRHRKLAATSDASKRWRPAIHVTGVITWGLLEIYFILPSSVPKDSNMNATILARCLDIAQESLEEGQSLPDHLLVQVDNTTRESKNQHFALFLSYLASSVFKSVECHYLQVSHTKNELDQRFSTMASIIKQAECIEDLEELRDYIKSHMTTAEHRKLVVEILPNTWNFQEWFAVTGIQLSGLVSTHFEPYANHVWRFQRRADVSGEIVSELRNVTPDDGDVVLTVKQFMCSQNPSQDPVLMLPLQAAQSLKGRSLTAMSPNPFAKKTLTEFRKTANWVASDPWLLLKGQMFLEEICSLNEAGQTHGEPPKLHFVFAGDERCDFDDGPILADLDPPGPGPAPREVRVAPKKRVMRRPAAPAKRPAMMAASRASPSCPAAESGVDPLVVFGRPAESEAESESAAAAGAVNAAADADPVDQDASMAAAAELPAADPGPILGADPAAPAAAAVGQRRVMHFGCSKCRKNPAGCPGRCRKFAAEGRNDYGYDEQGNVVRFEPAE
ncbi:unnamed protein product [Symbiodinium sp. CCMP2592]|nr:unnamed protein product [Symbiodinium sp. CCMP2592]CAE7709042.1 unnamed protein product [Symbiodinium sp. CCMP2592]